MREAKTQVEIRSLHSRSESDAFDLELFRETFANSLNHVVHKTARKSVQRFRTPRFRFTHKRYTVVLYAGLDLSAEASTAFCPSALPPTLAPPSPTFTLTLSGISTALFPIRDMSFVIC